MGSLKQRFWGVLGTSILAGCVSSSQVADRLNAEFTGKHVDQFFVKHGAPVNKHQLTSGDMLWVWSTRGAIVTGGGGFGRGCVIQIQTSADGTVKSLRILEDTIGGWTTSECHDRL